MAGSVNDELAGLAGFYHSGQTRLLPVSSSEPITGQGLAETGKPETLEQHFLTRLKIVRGDRSSPRLSAIDRVFHDTGFGTVVTGTLLDGTISAGRG